jgi:hypothetical protein
MSTTYQQYTNRCLQQYQQVKMLNATMSKGANFVMGLIAGATVAVVLTAVLWSVTCTCAYYYGKHVREKEIDATIDKLIEQVGDK